MTKWVTILFCIISFSCIAQNAVDVGNIHRFFSLDKGIFYGIPTNQPIVCAGDTLNIRCNTDSINYYAIDSIKVIYIQGGVATISGDIDTPIVITENCNTQIILPDTTGNLIIRFSVEIWFNTPTNVYSLGIPSATNVSYYAPNSSCCGHSIDILQQVVNCDTVTNTCSDNLGSSQAISICAGSSYLFNGTQLIQNGTYKDTLQTVQGCDSVVTLTLTVLPPIQTDRSQSICSGDSYFFNGQHSASGTYKDTLQTAQGCDSIVTLLLTVNPPLQESFSGSFYSNSYYLFNGIELTESGVYKDTLQNAQGCDSIITLTLSMVLAPDTPFISITASLNSVPESVGTIILTAHLSQVTANVVTADLELTGTATLNEDYTVSGTSFHFPAGALTDSVSLTIIDDPYYEGNEIIFAGLDVIHNALLGQPATATITIIDNENSSDPPPPPPILPTAIEEVNVLEAIKIYPVPAQDFVKIVMSADIPQIATLVDIQGRIVTEITIVSGENTIDLSGISSGTYVFRFTNKQYNYFTGAKPITVVR